MKSLKKYPLRHLTARVPWHDSGWSGKICDKPSANVACLKLENILASKNSVEEDKIAGRLFNQLSEGELPPCVRERASFMAPFEHSVEVNHPYHNTSKETHGHFRQTPLRVPPFTVMALPFKWMTLEHGEENADKFDFVFDLNTEPPLNFESKWMQGLENQKNTQDAFFGHIYPEESLVFIYAKQVPHVESNERILIGVGRVKHIGENTKYRTEKSGQSTCLVWERPIQHSIRQDLSDGFILPLKEIFDRASVNENFNVNDFVVKVPDYLVESFSFGSEHLRSDGALQILAQLQLVLQNIDEEFKGPWAQCLSWINSEAARLKKERGMRPGLGAALTAFGLKNGTFIAWELHQKTTDGDDPWQFLDKMFQQPKDILPPTLVKSISKTHQKLWTSLEKNEKSLLKLISRIDLTPDQALEVYATTSSDSSALNVSTKEILANPYRIYECSRLTAEPISFEVVDLGLTQPLDGLSEDDSTIDSLDDPRRIRALGVRVLELAASEGHTVLTKTFFIDRLKNFTIQNQPTISGPLIRLAEKEFKGEIEVLSVEAEESLYQLSRLFSFSSIISNGVNGLLRKERHDIKADWEKLLEIELGPPGADSRELRARQEKAASLRELAESPLSILTGPAGTGKTTMLKVLCDHPEIKKGDILLLAPTGKARVKLQSKSKLETKTLAQFLGSCGRFDTETQRYQLSSEPPVTVPRTVIVDECSMLTEEMLGALLQGMKGCHRLILVGDHDQLPPIGPGKPFVDIIYRLRGDNLSNTFPHVSRGLCELSITRRQKEIHGEIPDDLKLAQWFRSTPPDVDSDEIFSIGTKGRNSERLRLVEWKHEQELTRTLSRLLREELKIDANEELPSFNRLLGSEGTGSYFNMGAGKSAEDWQILSPLRGMLTGTSEINRNVHEQFRAKTIEMSYKYRRVPKPMGPEMIVYGDKVINMRNHKRGKLYEKQKYADVYPLDGALQYVANGEVGIVIGRFSKERGAKQPWQLFVNFSSQPDHSYSFTSKDFGDETEPILELAYALTVHKCQGSEFKTVFLILPNPCRLLSREMLYTALTRQQDKLIILHQGPFQEIIRFSSPSRSDNARRLTNLFLNPVPKAFEGSFLDQNLIHLAEDGTAMRSKSELFIYERLKLNGIEAQYERPLKLGEKLVIPDFTIDHLSKGGSIYWEHAGMMDDPAYRSKWEKKKESYHKNGVWTLENGGGPNGTLVVTEDSPNKGLSTKEIDQIIEKVKKIL
jgi:ATP-dependent exoDNAse (exonuclease V) alpha subunit